MHRARRFRLSRLKSATRSPQISQYGLFLTSLRRKRTADDFDRAPPVRWAGGRLAIDSQLRDSPAYDTVRTAAAFIGSAQVRMVIVRAAAGIFEPAGVDFDGQHERGSQLGNPRIVKT
jgi:hypothetical protein